MKKIFIFLFSFFFLMGCHISNPPVTHTDSQSGLPTMDIKIGNQLFTVEIAKTPAQREQGLMFRESMEKNHGMIFLFEEETGLSFWMKNTKIPLDIAWISKDKKIIDIQRMEPCVTDSCPLYSPQDLAQFVLEVNAGALSAKVGDLVEGNF